MHMTIWTQKILFKFTVILCACVYGNSLFAQQSDARECSKYTHSSKSLYLPVIFSFKDFSLRREDIYNSLNPRFENGEYISWRSETPVETRYDMASGRYVMHFCLGNWKERDQPVVLSLKLGLSRIDLDIKATGLQVERHAKTDTLIHPPVVLLDQPSPDWMLPIRSRISQTSKGESVIDFQIYNPSSKGLIGPELSMVARRGSGLSCFMAGPTYESSINMTVVAGVASSQGIRVVSTEPNYKDPIVREVLVEENACSFGTRMTVRLGETAVIKPDEIVRFVYKISGAELVNRYNIVLEFNNGRIYPETVDLGSL